MERYRQLTPRDQRIVELLAVPFELGTQSTIYDLFRDAGIRYSDRSAFSGPKTGEVLRELARSGFVVMNGTSARCNLLAADAIMRGLDLHAFSSCSRRCLQSCR
jgi:hypothetical protein